MFKHILMPVDGTLTMLPGVRRCLRMALEMAARVEAIHVVAPAGSNAAVDARSGAGTAHTRAAQIMQLVEREAREQGVACTTAIIEGAMPWQEIVAAARAGGADLICMSSHGRSAPSGAALGSQTAQVLLHAPVAVLVLR
ncbi:universal stress protein [Massilia sp. PWRC2]|uniref:universal stress protein n=1 Tax=Massilia sp. PWRC2 TaxID=2804626 RepID=UPI003CE86239